MRRVESHLTENNEKRVLHEQSLAKGTYRNKCVPDLHRYGSLETCLELYFPAAESHSNESAFYEL